MRSSRSRSWLSHLAVVVLCLASAAPATASPRTYLTFSGGAHVLTTDLSGDVVTDRALGIVELGIGTHLRDNLLLEFSLGRFGRQETDPVVITDIREAILPHEFLTYRVEANPLLLRLHYTVDDFRTGYLKPEVTLGVGAVALSRRLRPVLGLLPQTEHDMRPALEIGGSALFVLSPNFLGYFGPRYILMKRDDIADHTRHLDGLTFTLGFRIFLNSPSEELDAEEDDS